MKEFHVHFGIKFELFVLCKYAVKSFNWVGSVVSRKQKAAENINKLIPRKINKIKTYFSIYFSHLATTHYK